MIQNHDILADWFNLFQSLKKEHEIEIKNIYNMNEKKFMQKVIAKLWIMIFKYEKTHMTQCDNQEWVSLIEYISMNESHWLSIYLWMKESWSRELSSKKNYSRRSDTKYLKKIILFWARMIESIMNWV